MEGKVQFLALIGYAQADVYALAFLYLLLVIVGLLVGIVGLCFSYEVFFENDSYRDDPDPVVRRKKYWMPLASCWAFALVLLGTFSFFIWLMSA